MSSQEILPQIPLGPALKARIVSVAMKDVEISAGQEMTENLFGRLIPTEEREIPEMIRSVDLASVEAHRFITAAMGTSGFWLERINELNNKLQKESGHLTEVIILDRLRQLVSTAVRTETTKRVEQGEGAKLSASIRDYIDDRMLATLTDPALAIAGTGEKAGLTLPINTDPEVKTSLAVALVTAIDTTHAGLQMSPEDWQKQQLLGNDPIIQAHERLMVKLFAGIQYSFNVPLGSNLSTIIRSKDEVQLASFAMGLGIQAVCQPGANGNYDSEKFMVALSSLSSQRQKELLNISIAVWRSVPDGHEEQKSEIAKLINLSGDRQSIDIVGKSDVGSIELDLSRRLLDETKEKIGSAILKSNIPGFNDSNSMANHIENMISADHNNESVIIGNAGAVARKIIFAQVISGYLEDVFKQKAAGGTGIGAALPQLKAAADMFRLLTNGLNPKFSLQEPENTPDNMKPLAFVTDYTRTLLAGPQGSHAHAFSQQITEYFNQAKKFGIEKELLIDIHNRVGLMVGAANSAIVTIFQPEQNRYYNHPLGFLDTLRQIGAATTEAILEETVYAMPGCNMYQDGQTSNGMGKYRHRDAESRPYNDYARREEKSVIDAQVSEALDPLRQLGALRKAKLLLDQEKHIGAENALTLVAGLKVSDYYSPNKEPVGDAAYRSRESKAQARAAKIESFLPDINGAIVVQADVEYAKKKIKTWQREWQAAAKSISLLKIGDRKQANKIKALIEESVGDKLKIGINIADPNILTFLDSLVTAKAAEVAGRLTLLSNEVEDPADVVAAYLKNRTNPPFDPNAAEKPNTLTVPPLRSRFEQPTETQVLNLGATNWNIGPDGEGGHLLAPLFHELRDQQAAVNRWQLDALAKLINQMYANYMPPTISEAIKAYQEKLGKPVYYGSSDYEAKFGDINEPLRQALQRLIQSSIAARLDGLDLSAVRLEPVIKLLAKDDYNTSRIQDSLNSILGAAQERKQKS
ncbi:hypothetical protein HY214_04025 [Candidatus Roizmanbacteria bacterium]|nr:hypothetical protein [Candidatus Roizmanbacteria bacterium]